MWLSIWYDYVLLFYLTKCFTQLEAASMVWDLLQLLCSFNAKNLEKYSFRGFKRVSVSKFWKVAPSYFGCFPTAFTIFASVFIKFNENPSIFGNSTRDRVTEKPTLWLGLGSHNISIKCWPYCQKTQIGFRSLIDFEIKSGIYFADKILEDSQ